MAKSLVICEKCSDVIESKDELITTTLIFAVVPYHERCFANDLKGAKLFFLDNYPLNGFSGNFFFILSIIIGLLLLIFTENKWFSALALIPIAYRMYSYFFYERHTRK